MPGITRCALLGNTATTEMRRGAHKDVPFIPVGQFRLRLAAKPARKPPQEPYPAPSRSGRKKAAISAASSAGCSKAAKCPPLSIGVQRRMSV